MTDPDNSSLTPPLIETENVLEPTISSSRTLSSLTLPGLKESPFEQYRVSSGGVLVVDQGTQTATTTSIFGTPARLSVPDTRRSSRAVMGAAVRARSADPATAAITKWARLLNDSSARRRSVMKETGDSRKDSGKLWGSDQCKNTSRHSVVSTPIRGSPGFKINSSTSNDNEERSNNEADQDSTDVDLKQDNISNKQDKISHQTSEGSLEYKQQTLKSFVYDILENPETSKAAQIFSWFSMTLIVLSVGTFIAETMPEFKEDLKKTWHETTTGTFFFLSETFFIFFFTLELVGRFITCPNKKAFAKNVLNIIDLVSILPFYVELMVPKRDDGDGNKSSMSSLVILRVLRLFRVLRIFKLSRHSNNMIAFGIALRGSLMELMSLALFLAIDIVVFASILYFCEMKDDGSIAPDDPNNFSSIPAACWWAVATITTVGYGDMYPRTWLGKIFGCFCVFSGILVIAFQVPIIVAKFTWTFMQKSNQSSADNNAEGESTDGEMEKGT